MRAPEAHFGGRRLEDRIAVLRVLGHRLPKEAASLVRAAAKAQNADTVLLDTAGRANDSALMMQAHQAMCVTHLCLGVPGITVDPIVTAARCRSSSSEAGNPIRPTS